MICAPTDATSPWYDAGPGAVSSGSSTSDVGTEVFYSTRTTGPGRPELPVLVQGWLMLEQHIVNLQCLRNRRPLLRRSAGSSIGRRFLEQDQWRYQRYEPDYERRHDVPGQRHGSQHLRHESTSFSSGIPPVRANRAPARQPGSRRTS